MVVRRWRGVLSRGVALCLLCAISAEGEARVVQSPRQSIPSLRADAPPLPSPQAFQAVLLQDAGTGQVLFAQNHDRRWPLASLTKMMVGLLAFEELERGRLSLRTPVTISRRASRAGGRMIALRPGEVLPFGELLRAMLVTSANDAAVAVAERLKGSVEACVRAMNQRAQELGMHQTRYRTVNGLPPRNSAMPDTSTAEDTVLLAQALLSHARVLRWTALSYAPFRTGRVRLPNTNRLVGKIAGVDGLKTGFTRKAQYNLVTTAQRDQLRLIAIVLGGQSSQIRFQIAADLLEWGFANFTHFRLIKGGEPLWAEVQVENGNVSTLQPIAASDAAFVIRKSETHDLRVSLQLPAVIAAPISRHQVLGTVVVRDGAHILAVIPALSPWHVPRADWIPSWQ